MRVAVNLTHHLQFSFPVNQKLISLMKAVTVPVILAWKFPGHEQTNGAKRMTKCKTKTFYAMDSLLTASEVWKMASTDNSFRLEVRVMNFSFSSLWFENRHDREGVSTFTGATRHQIYLSAIRIKQTLLCVYTVACSLMWWRGGLYWC
jgi:hypothetical protein